MCDISDGSSSQSSQWRACDEDIQTCWRSYAGEQEKLIPGTSFLHTSATVCVIIQVSLTQSHQNKVFFVCMFLFVRLFVFSVAAHINTK